MVLPPSRSAREALARDLRAQGLRLREIAAELSTRPSNRRAYERIEVGRCLEAVAAVWSARGEPPTFHGYDEARAPGDPCAATIRTRCGSWTRALAMASVLVAEPGSLAAAA